MKRLIIFYLLISAASNVRAQDAKAEEILKAVSNKYKSYKTLSAAFNVTVENQKENTRATQSGKIIIKGNQYKLMMQDQDIISDGKTIWTYLKESNEVQISEAAEKGENLSPADIFTIYEKGFRSKFTGEKSEKGKTFQQIELIPEDAKKAYSKVQIKINKADKFITSAKLFSKNGIHLLYTVEKFEPDLAVPDNTFVFEPSKHQGIEVVDLR